MIYTINYANQLKMATRDIAPRLAQFVNIYFRNLAFENDVDGGIMSIQAGFYFPGLLPHHSLKVQGAFQHQGGFKTISGSPNDKLYLFSSPVFFPRGNAYRAFEDLATASIEYRLPLIEPDFSFGRLVYIKRIKANFFGDFAKGSTFYNWTELKDGKQVVFARSNIGNYTSLGIDLTAQFHIMRFSQQFEAGFRTIYLPNMGQYLFQPLILNIGF
jgi:hypothetical protein